MDVECVFFGPLRESVGEKTVVRDTDATTVGDLLADLEADYPEMQALVEDGELVPGVAVTLNTKHVQHLAGLDTELSADDVLRLTPAVYGGSGT
jgi:molybdopterin synthase sulfur carrier subunit